MPLAGKGDSTFKKYFFNFCCPLQNNLFIYLTVQHFQCTDFMLSKFFYFFAIFDMNGSKRWFQTKFWFWHKHVLLVAFLNSTFFNNNKTYCIIQHKKMLTLSTIVLHFFCFLQKGYFCKRNVFLAVYPKIYFVKLLFCKKKT